MSDRPTLRPRFWERHALDALTPAEWEALCDGCGRCCLHKLEDADTHEIAYTCVACKLLDDDTCRCAQYDIRKEIVPDCVVLTPDNIAEIAYWMPETCAYRRLHQGRGLPAWHPLLTGDPDSVHRAGISVRHRTVPEFEVTVDEYEDYLLKDDA
ncbi:MAG: YcgN family cysteine cluster protein [Alphaproteobacteria bacterium]|nr:MAG: YcgN family cysteine cluster protein [Alphaproteobacteria bacterium]